MSSTWHGVFTNAPGAHMTSQVISELSNIVTAQVTDSTDHLIKKNLEKYLIMPLCNRRH